MHDDFQASPVTSCEGVLIRPTGRNAVSMGWTTGEGGPQAPSLYSKEYGPQTEEIFAKIDCSKIRLGP